MRLALLSRDERGFTLVELRPGDPVPEDALRGLLHQALALGARDRRATRRTA